MEPLELLRRKWIVVLEQLKRNGWVTTWAALVELVSIEDGWLTVRIATPTMRQLFDSRPAWCERLETTIRMVAGLNLSVRTEG
jgi:hypothetical protein